MVLERAVLPLSLSDGELYTSHNLNTLGFFFSFSINVTKGFLLSCTRSSLYLVIFVYVCVFVRTFKFYSLSMFQCVTIQHHHQ